MTEEAPLCICGKPRKRAIKWIQVTGSYYYATCGDHACSNQNRHKSKVGKKPKRITIGSLNNPHKICERPGCNNEVGETKMSTNPRTYCSTECRLLAQKSGMGTDIKKRKIITDHKRKYLSEIYADIKSGATKSEIRRKYSLDTNDVSYFISFALQNREREIQNKLHEMKA